MPVVLRGEAAGTFCAIRLANAVEPAALGPGRCKAMCRLTKPGGTSLFCCLVRSLGRGAGGLGIDPYPSVVVWLRFCCYVHHIHQGSLPYIHLLETPVGNLNWGRAEEFLDKFLYYSAEHTTEDEAV